MSSVSGYYLSDPGTMARMKGSDDYIAMVFKSRDAALESCEGKLYPGEFIYRVSGRLSVDNGSTMNIYLESYSVS